MTTTILYGIPNCDTVKKARDWLDAQGVAYQFHDYKKSGAEEAQLRAWSQEFGWDKVLNRAGQAVDRWCFEGFLPVKGSGRTARLAALGAKAILSSDIRACRL